jgi:TonB-dependent receptor
MSKSKFVLFLGAASAMLGLNVMPAAAQQAQPAKAEDKQTVIPSEDVVVIGEIRYRNRSEATAPQLEYGVDFFQKFEPLTVGDALKRVPSVAFLSDVNESDGVRLRGLDPAYTQILINGEKVPGAGADSGAFGNGSDGAFFVDRIPAELIERVEIVRSSSANRSGDAMAGGLNIVLRDSYALDGGFIRLGGLYFAGDETFGGTIGGAYGMAIGQGRLLIGANIQDRHNPKSKFSGRFNNPPGVATRALVDIEDQTDVRDGRDYSLNFAYETPAGPGELKLDGFFVRTKRTENEDSIEYQNVPNRLVAGSSPLPAFGALRTPANILTFNDNDVDIKQTSWSLSSGYTFDMLGGKTKIKLGYGDFKTREDEFENESEYLRDSDAAIRANALLRYPEIDRFTRDLALVDIQDKETSAKLEHKREIGALELEFGVQYQTKDRDALNQEGRFRANQTGGTLTPDASGNSLSAAPTAPIVLATVSGGATTITRTNIDPFVMLSGKTGPLRWELGVRAENAETEIEDRTVTGAARKSSRDETTVLPSAHLKFDATDNDRFSFSVARTIRNPSFRFLSPAVLSAELGDNDFVGNPALTPETAWGVDAGYERRLGKTGVVGVNLFYRDVTDLIELTTRTVGGVPVVGSGGAGTFVYTARNTGSGTVSGVELDLSTSLSAVGMKDTGVFLNYSWLDSEVKDEFGSRRFNSQSDTIFNVGFIQDIPAWGASFGATYRKQGDAFSRVVGEEVKTSYEGDLGAFVEKRFSEGFTLRLTGSNLLDASKDEVFDKFGTVTEQRGRVYDEYEIESEKGGAVYQLIGRFAF